VIVLGLVLAPATTSAAQDSVGDPAFQIGVFSYRADGAPNGWAWAGEDRGGAGSGVWINRIECQMGAFAVNSVPSAPNASDMWKFSARVVSSNAHEAVIQLDWHRTLEDGQVTTVPGRSERLTLMKGDRVVLDSVMPAASCNAARIDFEARYESRQPVAGRTNHIYRPVGSGRGPAPMPHGGRTGAGGGVAPTSDSGIREPVRVGISGTSLGDTHQLFDVSLWLVHSAPGKEDAITRQVLRTGRAGGTFTFAPIWVITPEGPVVIQVDGSLSVTSSPEAGEQLVFVANRRVSTDPHSAAPRDRRPDVQGTSRTAMPMPGPEDVLAFEMPPVRVQPRGTSLPDRFSVRLQIVPR
jgi:hypothetical protein